MLSNIDLLLGGAYLLGLPVLAIGSAMLPWRYYGLGIFAYIVAFVLGIGWAMKGADGPGGFGVEAFHGLVQILFLSSHAIRLLCAILRKVFSYLRRDKLDDRSPNPEI